MKNRLKSRDIAPGVRATSQDHDWVDSFGASADELAPMRGIVNGLLIAIPFWVVIILLIVWWYHG